MLVYNYWPRPVGGAETQCRRLTHALAGAGVSSMVVTSRNSFKESSREMDENVLICRCLTFQPVVDLLLRLRGKLRRNDKKRPTVVEEAGLEEAVGSSYTTLLFEKIIGWLNAFFFLIGVARVCWGNRKQFVLIHVHCTEWLAGFAIFFGKVLRVPVLCKEATAPAFSLKSHGIPLGRFWDRQRFKGSYVAMTPNVLEQMVECGIDRKNIFLIPNGIDIPDDKSDLPGEKTVLWVGNFSQGIQTKGLDILFKAWISVLEHHKEARLLLVGGGDSTAVMALACEDGITGRVEFVGYSSDVDAYYKQADVVVLPSRIEGMSNVLLEAHAWGIPSVASTIPANQAVAIDGDTGFLVPVGDSDMLAKRITYLFEHRIVQEQMAKCARKRAVKFFSMETTAKKIHSCYLELLKKS